MANTPSLEPRRQSLRNQFEEFKQNPGETGVAVTAAIILLGALYSHFSGQGVQQNYVAKQNPAEIISERVSDGAPLSKTRELPEALRAAPESEGVQPPQAMIPVVTITVHHMVTHTATVTAAPEPSATNTPDQGTPEPTATSTPSSTDSPTASPSPTTTSSATPTPVPEPTPEPTVSKAPKPSQSDDTESAQDSRTSTEDTNKTSAPREIPIVGYTGPSSKTTTDLTTSDAGTSTANTSASGT